MTAPPKNPVLPRLLGALTAGYGAAVLASPALLARPVELTGRDGSVPASTAVLVRSIGARDVASGLALVAASGRPALRVAIAVRVAGDAADALVFGLALPSRRARRKAALAAGGWALLCATSARTLRSR